MSLVFFDGRMFGILPHSPLMTSGKLDKGP